MSTSDPSKPWDNSSDILQGIMGTRAMPPSSQLDLSSDGLSPSDLTLGDPASFLGFQFASDQAIPHPTHPSILHPWPLYHKPSSSPLPQLFDPSTYPPLARWRHEQDAWNPLQSSAPIHPAAFVVPRSHQVYGLDRRSSSGHHSTPSEAGSQYTSLHLSDSGYSTQGCTTRSVAASYALESACSPFLAPLEHEQDDRVSALDLNSAPYGDGIDPLDRMDSPSLLCQDVIKCDYPGCQWTGKCPSDKRKHEARHRKLFKCDEPNCARKEGFGTINDLARHKKCVHKQEPERGPKVLYMCFGQNCPRRNKKWPRLDNFRQHLARMHNDEDVEELLRKSHEWYETCVKPQELGPSFIDSLSDEAPTLQTEPVTQPKGVMRDLGEDASSSFQTVCPSSETATPDTAMRLNDEYKNPNFDHALVQLPLAKPHPSELPALRALTLDSSLDQKAPIAAQLDTARNGKMDDMVNEAALNMINAMTKAMNTNERRRSQQSDVGDEMMDQNEELSDRKRDMLQRILSAALDRLSGQPGSGHAASQDTLDDDSEKKGWIQCEFCTKRTRLRCEMKKHKKRHERPYGCTFAKCNKTFGSKADWKRHENSQHFHAQCWRCTLADATQEDLPCARLFYRQEMYVQHLKKHHDVDDEEEVRAALCKNRINRDGDPRPSHYWCGFCRVLLPLKTQGVGAWNERYNHIDVEHFKKGERVEDWLLPSGHLTKSQEREEMKKQRTDGNGYESEPAMDENSDDESVSSDYAVDHEPLHDDMMVIDKEPPPNLSSDLGGDPLPHNRSMTYSFPGASNLRKRKFPSLQSTSDSYRCGEPGVPSLEKRSRVDSDHLPGASLGPFYHGADSMLSEPSRLSHEPDPAFCCQCRQGPFALTYTNQCPCCHHGLCEGCEDRNPSTSNA
ncbi:hypothetical protein ASPCADRAFT_166802 [Aspergillus carbonarius ITEM 5010]|uniref:C2H2-type domain-containing protein n=1 Tax=Aspergillus carbonarius (strain ITEM 5010) TaxID=602072 RepID=A0A1R3RP46_ASPC5|nr:hypothetical protein ASPCADRAFT_166802 [Aspergillus carbonarius ITEM 5010]